MLLTKYDLPNGFNIFYGEYCHYNLKLKKLYSNINRILNFVLTVCVKLNTSFVVEVI